MQCFVFTSLVRCNFENRLFQFSGVEENLISEGQCLLPFVFFKNDSRLFKKKKKAVLRSDKQKITVTKKKNVVIENQNASHTFFFHGWG